MASWSSIIKNRRTWIVRILPRAPAGLSPARGSCSRIECYPRHGAVSTGQAGTNRGDNPCNYGQSALPSRLSLSALASCSSMPQSGEHWRSLFDGKTLAGWTPKIRGFPLGENYRDTFRVKDGAIVVSYDKYDQFGERFGHLFYQTPFKAYRLRLRIPLLDGASGRHAGLGHRELRRDDLRRGPEGDGRRRQLPGVGGGAAAGAGAGAGTVQRQHVFARHQRGDGRASWRRRTASTRKTPSRPERGVDPVRGRGARAMER